MSVIGNLARVTEGQLADLKRTPAAITGLFYPDLAETAAPTRRGLWARLFGKKASAPAPTTRIGVLGDEDQTDLDKAWHTLHFLFTGSAWDGDFPQGFLVSCGAPIGDVDVGYGPARGFTAAEVAEISRYLESIDRDQLRASLDPKKIIEAEIYPNFGSDGPISDEDWEYIGGAFDQAREFLRETSKRKMALLVYLN